MSQDKIADLFSSLKNASRVGKKEVVSPFSQLNLALAKLLVKEGYLSGVKKKKEKGKPEQLVFYLLYKKGKPVLREAKRISKPGRRFYVQAKDLGSYNRRLGVVIVSTSRGIMTGKQAQKENLGGELIGRVW